MCLFAEIKNKERLIEFFHLKKQAEEIKRK